MTPRSSTGTPPTSDAGGLFIVDNAPGGRTGHEYLRQQVSPAPSKNTQTFLLVGRKINWSAIDSMRSVDKGTSEKHLQEIYGRRNDIAHAADRIGRSRRAITTDEERGHIERAKEIIEVLDQHLNDLGHAERP